MVRLLLVAGLCALLEQALAIGQQTCVTFQPSNSSFPIVVKKKATPILVASDDWPGVQRAASDFVSDIQRVTGAQASLTNVTSTPNVGSNTPIIIGTLGKSSLIDNVVNATGLDVSSIRGQWEAFIAREVQNPLPGVSKAYVIIGADKRGTIYGLYDHSEQFGVSPWYWWADVPTTQHPELYVDSAGCSHGSPTVKYRGIFLNDEQPALQSWAAAKFTNGTGAPQTGSPFNSKFYTKVFELILRLKGNYLWPAMWSSAFGLDDPQNQFLADMYGIVMGTSHQEPMMRATPPEFSVEFPNVAWDYTKNNATIKKFWLEGVQRAKNFESVYTIGMRGFGDLPLSESTNIALLEQVVQDQTDIFKQVYGQDYDVSSIPQIWALYKEVEGYYDDGMQVPDYVTLLWSDDNWGNIRRFPIASERNRTGGAGVYYHFDFVGDPRDYKWIGASQIEKVYEQMSAAVDFDATRLWIVNVGDLKPYEREIEFFLGYGWNATRWNPDNLNTFVTGWAQREFDVPDNTAAQIGDIVANLTRFNARRKPELLDPATFTLIDYREADNVLSAWNALEKSSTAIYNSLSSNFQASFFQLVHYPVLASSNIGKMIISAGLNNLRASQARLSTNDLAETVESMFENDFDLETQYNSLLDGKWVHMMDQTRLGYYYWQQPMTNTMPAVNRVQSRKLGLGGVMRIVPEGTRGAWPGDNPNQCAQGYGCPPPSISVDNFSPINNRYVDVSAGGPISFAFTVTGNSSWIKLSTTKGQISPTAPEQRVYIDIDWNQLQDGANSAQVTFKATASGQPPSSVPITINAQKRSVAGGFKGFVEGAGVVSIEAAHATRNNAVNGITWKELPGYGRTLSAMTPLPRSDSSFDVGSGPSLEYDFYNFNTNSGNLTVTVYVSPSFNTLGMNRPVRLATQLDSQGAQTSQPMPDAAPGALPAAWSGVNGFVANSIIPVTTNWSNVSPGAHTFKIFMVEPTVVVQKIVINAGGLRASYLGPPESIQV
ncbi:glycoside hydrolase family 115 protein [Macrolepiota fuliginosa MF-IS2]|uniref:Glycoside hydrolase family 115 protein n=1 Tax=Macrolepiota fuliginosa MF-IS2 TaxID=1400762 RepID=A0A9P5XFN5_9AGAR|nr:glycoside hydrolase family 115 protein [Macrolepiota fuliginosa MF-IS2]